MIASELKDRHIEIRTGLTEDENGQYPVWIALVKTLKGKCSLGHNHWDTKTLKHIDLYKLIKLLEEQS